MSHNILVGCDPEIFVKKDGLFVSAHALIPGDKKNPFKVDKGAVQVDGMALEFNIQPASTEQEFVGNVQEVMKTLALMVPGYELAPVPVADFPLEYIAAQPLEARELGCEPDYNAYTGAANIKPNAELPMRTASGHIHVGWTNDMDIFSQEHASQCRAAVQQLDIVLGLASLFYDDDVRRRSMYGKGGALRFKPYGVEYRTLSNAWLLSAERMAWAFRNTKKAMEMLMDGRALFLETTADVEAIINTSDKAAAEKLIRQFDLEMVA